MSGVVDPIRVIVVDDQRLFVVGSATEGREAIRLVDELRPDVTLMDIRMPVMDGIEATHRITRGDAHPARIIILTTFQREEAVFQAIRGGASAFVTKDATPEFLLDTIRAVHAGNALVAPAATMTLIKEFGGPGPERGDDGNVDDRTVPLDSLSPREHEIFLLAARGLSNADIATTAFISDATVKTHIRSILMKLRLENRVQIVVFAYENGLVRL